MSGEIIRTESDMTVAGHSCPVAAYLAGLTSPKSRRTMSNALARIVEMTSDDFDSLTYPWHRLTFAHTSAIRTALVERYSPASVNVMLSALRGVLKACWRLNLIEGDTYRRAVDVANVKAETLPRGRALSGGEIRSLFRACERTQSTSACRDAALLALLYGGGLRRSEVVALQLSDYDVDTGTVMVREGKGRKERLVYLPIGARDAMVDWLAARGDTAGPLLLPISKGGMFAMRTMSTQAVYERLRYLGKRAGVKAFSPHDLRRSFVSDLLDLGADVSLVQKLAGHADINTTQRYDRRPEASKRKAAELLHVPFRVTH